jgi:hypothetical protein
MTEKFSGFEGNDRMRIFTPSLTVGESRDEPWENCISKVAGTIIWP